jgi:hypothetical protein
MDFKDQNMIFELPILSLRINNIFYTSILNFFFTYFNSLQVDYIS